MQLQTEIEMKYLTVVSLYSCKITEIAIIEYVNQSIVDKQLQL